MPRFERLPCDGGYTLIVTVSICPGRESLTTTPLNGDAGASLAVYWFACVPVMVTVLVIGLFLFPRSVINEGWALLPDPAKTSSPISRHVGKRAEPSADGTAATRARHTAALTLRWSRFAPPGAQRQRRQCLPCGLRNCSAGGRANVPSNAGRGSVRHSSRGIGWLNDIVGPTRLSDGWLVPISIEVSWKSSGRVRGTENGIRSYGEARDVVTIGLETASGLP